MENTLKDLIQAAHLHIVGDAFEGTPRKPSIVHHLIGIKELLSTLDRHGMSDDIEIEDLKKLYQLYVEIENYYGLDDIPTDLATFLLLNAYRYVSNAVHLTGSNYIELRREIDDIRSVPRFHTKYEVANAIDVNASPEKFLPVRDVKEFLIQSIGQSMVRSLANNDIETYLNDRELVAQYFKDGYISKDRLLKIFEKRVEELKTQISKGSDDLDFQNASVDFYRFTHVLRASISEMSEVQRVDMRRILKNSSAVLTDAYRGKFSQAAIIAKSEVRGFLKSLEVPREISILREGSLIEEAVSGGYKFRTLGSMAISKPEARIVAQVTIPIAGGFILGVPEFGVILGMTLGVSQIPLYILSQKLQKIANAAQRINPNRPNAPAIFEELAHRSDGANISKAARNKVERYSYQVEKFDLGVVEDPSTLLVRLPETLGSDSSSQTNSNLAIA